LLSALHQHRSTRMSELPHPATDLRIRQRACGIALTYQPNEPIVCNDAAITRQFCHDRLRNRRVVPIMLLRNLINRDPDRGPQHFGHLPQKIERDVIPLVVLDVTYGGRGQRQLGGNVFAAQSSELSESLQVSADPSGHTYLVSAITDIRIKLAPLMLYVNCLHTVIQG